MGIQIDRTDGLASSSAIKGPVRAATTEDIPLGGLQTIDGVSLEAGDRVLVKNQTDARDNGLWVVDTGNWRRCADFNNNRDVRRGTQIFVTEGNRYADTVWFLKEPALPTIGSSDLAFDEVLDTARIKRAARFTESLEANSLQVNEVPASGGGFPRTVPQEIADIFAGGNPDNALPNLAPIDLAECLIIPPTEGSTNFVAPNTPWMDVGGFMYRVMPVDIRTSLYNAPLNIPLFEPVTVNEGGMLTWRYIGEEPIHTILSGSITAIVRSHGTDEESFQTLVLELGGVDLPHLEMGQNRGRRFLAASVGAAHPTFRLTDAREFNDLCFPVDAEAIQNGQDNPPNFYNGSVPGYIHPDYEELQHESPPNSGNAVGPEVQTTDWIDVSGINTGTRSFLMTFDGTSNRSRIQWRDVDGVIHYFGSQSVNRSSYRIFRLPEPAVAFRIYYTGEGTTCADNNVDIRALGGTTSTLYDPLKGWFSLRTFNIHRDIVLWPGATYFLSMRTIVYDGANGREWGFRYQSGGMSFRFDAGRLRKTLAKKLFRSV